MIRAQHTTATLFVLHRLSINTTVSMLTSPSEVASTICGRSEGQLWARGCVGTFSAWVPRARRFARERASGSCSDGPEDRSHAHNSDCPLHIVGQDRRACFCGDVSEASRSEVGRAHPLFQRGKDVLDGASADVHRFRHGFEPSLHPVQNRLVFPAAYALLLSGGALGPG